MNGIEAVREALPETARDIKINLQTVLQDGPLSPAQKWGVAVASAAAARHGALRDAVVAEARKNVPEAVVEDGLAAAVLMAMNNVYYRFRHMSGKPVYTEKPARLRMSRIGRPAGPRADFELFCLAASAIEGCEMCIQAHEKVVLEGGLTEDQVHDAVRIAATMHGAAVGLETADVPRPAEAVA